VIDLGRMSLAFRVFASVTGKAALGFGAHPAFLASIIYPVAACWRTLFVVRWWARVFCVRMSPYVHSGARRWRYVIDPTRPSVLLDRGRAKRVPKKNRLFLLL